MVRVGSLRAAHFLSLFLAVVMIAGLLTTLERSASADPGTLPEQQTGSAEGLSHRASSEDTAAKDKPHHLDKGGPPAKGVPEDKPRAQPAFDKPKRSETSVEVDRSEQPGKARGFDEDTSREMPEWGGPDRQVFQNDDGTVTVRHFQGRQMFERPGKGWQKIDPTLVTEERGQGWRSKADSEPKRFARSANARQIVSVELETGRSYGFGVGQARGATGEIDGDTITYSDVRTDADLELQATPVGVKETIILKSPDAPTEWDFPLVLDGLTASLDDEGAVLLSNADGDVEAVIPPGYMEDSNIDERSGDGARSHDVEYRISGEPGQQVLHVAADPEWIADPDRVFPVLVDPTVQRSSNGSTYVLKPYRNDYSGESELRVGTWNGGSNIARSFVKFNSVSSALSGMKILDARLGVYNIWSYSCNSRNVFVRPITESWPTSGLKEWPGPSAGSEIARSSFAHGYASSCGPRWKVINLGDAGVDLVQGWVRGKPNYGLRLSASSTDSYGWKKFASANTPNAPYLQVTYLEWWADYSVGSMTKAPTPTADGTMRVTVKNDGKDTWTSSNSYELGYRLWDRASGSEFPTSATARTKMTKNVATGQSITLDGKIKKLDPGRYRLRWDMAKTGSFKFSKKGVPWSVAVNFEIPNQLPYVTSMSPLSGFTADTLRPTLRLTGEDPDNWPGEGLLYQFRLCDEDGSNCTTSSSSSSQTWQVPEGLMSWSKTYRWQGRVSDTENWGPWSGAAYLSTKVPQPAITSHLGGKSGGGVDPGVGNFTTSATDASVAAVGPDLSVRRTYNSLDPRRDLVFGSGWSTRWDTRLVPDDDDTGNVVVTYASGRQARFGKNHDGSFAPPPGQQATLVEHDGGGWTLRTVGNIHYEFDVEGKLAAITDTVGHEQTLSYGDNGRLTKATDATSGRSLSFTWADGRVTSVTTGPDPELSWTYGYEGDWLTSACNPEAECAGYAYEHGSGYRTMMVDSNPIGYWRLGDAATGTVVSEVPGLDKNLAGAASGVTASSDSPIEHSPLPSAAFDGSSSYVKYDNPVRGMSHRSVELWFKTSTTQGGVLFNTSKFEPGETGSNGSMPVLYVGTDGKLHGHFCNGRVEGITSPNTVNNGAWQHVVLSQTAGSQTLYLNGQPVGTQDSGYWCGQYRYAYVGAGLVTTADWPARPSDDWGYLQGSIAEAAVHQRPLSATEVAEQYAARVAADRLTQVTRPGGAVDAGIAYDSATERVNALTDANGAVWEYGAPNVEQVSGEESVWRTRVAVTDPIGEDTVYSYDPTRGGRLVEVADPAGRGGSRTYDYDEGGFLYRITDPNENAVELRHDERGNLISRTTPYTNSVSYTEYWEHFVNPDDPLDPRNDQVTFHRDGRSESETDDRFLTRYVHNLAGQVIEERAPGATGGMQRRTFYHYYDGTQNAPDGGKQPAGLLASKVDPAGETHWYEYTSKGDLSGETDPAADKRWYAHDGIGRVFGTSVLRPDGSGDARTFFTHDGASRVIEEKHPVETNEVTGAEHQLRTVNSYNVDGTLASTTVSDIKGGDEPRTTTYGYDEFGRQNSVTDPEGGVETVAYDQFGNVVSRNDAAGSQFSYTYVSTHTGWQLATTTVHDWSGDGGEPRDVVLESRAYDPAGRLASETDAMGSTLKYTYRKMFGVAQITLADYLDPDTGETTDLLLEHWCYSGTGKPTCQTQGGMTHIALQSYDPGDRLVTVKESQGLLRTLRTTETMFDDVDNPVEVTTKNPDGSVASRTEFEYDALGRETKRIDHVTDSDAVVTTTTRDVRGLPTAVVDPRGNEPGAEPGDFTTELTHDVFGQLTKVTAPPVAVESDGSEPEITRPVTATGYNAFGEVTHERDANGNVTRAGYDKAGRVASVSLPDYLRPGTTEPITATARTEYDAAGRVIAEIDPAGFETTYGYDELGNLRRQTDPPALSGQAGGTTITAYTPTGLPSMTSDPTGAQTYATYDQLGRPLTSTVVEREPELRYLTTEPRHDRLGNVIRVTSPMGRATTTEYDALSRPLTVTDSTGFSTETVHDSLGNVLRVDQPGLPTRKFSYDLAGRVTSSWNEDGDGNAVRAEHFAHDAAGNRTSSTNAVGAQVRHSYDALDRLTKIRRQVSESEWLDTSYGYDAAGNITRSTDGNGNSTVFTVNSWGLPESTIEPATAQHPDAGDRTYTVAYNSVGLMASLTKPGGVRIANAYDPQGNLLKQTATGATASTPDRVFTYDQVGRMTSVSAPGGANTYSYDDRGNLLSAQGPSGDTELAWDDDGELISTTTGAGMAEFGYDAAGRLTSAVDPVAGVSAAYGYDGAGRVSSVGFGGASRSLGYDEFGRLASDTITDSGGSTSAQVSYGYDDADRLTSKNVSGLAGSANNSYGYDDAGRLVSWNNGGPTVSFVWDDAGNLVERGQWAGTFNERNQLVEHAAASLTYSARGTLSSITEDGATIPIEFNAFDEMVAVNGDEYSYDGLNRLVGRAGAGSLTYVGTSRKVASAGGWSYSYSPGGDVLGAGDGTVAGMGWTDQHTDLIGVIDPGTGALVGSRSYDPFGSIYGESGPQPSLGFQHQYTDPGTGATNMGSRWYNRHTGTFASRDTAGLDPRDTLNANRYAYAGGSPLNYTDPDGQAVLAVCAVPVVAPVCAKGAAAGAAAGAKGWAWLSSAAAGVWVSLGAGTAVDPTLGARVPGATGTASAAPSLVRDGWSSWAHARPWRDPRIVQPGGGYVPGPPAPPPFRLPPAGPGGGSGVVAGGGGSGISAAAAAEAARLAYWGRIVTERANTPAPPPKPTVTVGQATKALWEAVNDLTNAIDLGVVDTGGVDAEFIYNPDAVDQVYVGPGQAPPSSRTVFSDGDCAVGHTWRTTDGYAYNRHTTYDGCGGAGNPKLPKQLQKKSIADTHVYFGRDPDGKDVYVGISNNVPRRDYEHGNRFRVEPITAEPLTRGQARAIEEALILRAGGTHKEGGRYENLRHSISPRHAYYGDAVAWGEAWLRGKGF